MARRALKATFSALLIAAVAGAIVALAWYFRPMPMAQTVRVAIPPGASVREAARLSAEATGAPRIALERLLIARLPPQRLRAGTYELVPGMTPQALLEKFERGDVLYAQLTIPEGWTFAQMRKAVEASGAVRIDTAGLSDAQLMAKLGVPDRPAEGWFMPDTYRFAHGASDLSVYRLAHQAMRDALQTAWAKRAQDLPVRTMDEALILASIVEKETGVSADRGKVAAVFVNRLRLGMRLQTDPTVIYGLGERFDGNLRKRDLENDTPYNTYTRAGLPPTPIALPGRASIEAALNPADTKALYFVARGDGSSEFSETLSEHNRAVDRFQRQRR